MKRIKSIILISLLISLLFTGNLFAKGKEQKIKGQARVNFRSAVLYAREKKIDKALSFYLKVIEEYPDHVVSLFNIAGIYNNEAFENPDKANELYAKSTEYYKKVISTMDAIPDWKEYEDFEKYRKEADKMIANQWNRTFKEAYELFYEEKYDESERIFNELVKETPDSLKTYQMLAAIYDKKGDKAKQLEYFNLILAKNPNDEKVILNIADDFYQSKNYPKAIEYFEKLIILAPSNAEYTFFTGLSYLYIEKKDKALEYFEKTLAIDPKNVDALANAAYIAQSTNNDTKATELLSKLYEADQSEENLSTLCYHLSKVESWNEMIKYAEIWYNLNQTKKEPVQLLILGAMKTKNKALETKYTAILKKM